MQERKTILFLSATSDLGGAEKVLLSCAKFLDPQKYEIILLAQSEGLLTQEFEKLSKEVVFLELPAWRKTKNILNRYWALLRLIKMIREKHVSVVHCNAFRLTPYLIYCSRILRIPAFIHLHDRLTHHQRESFFLAQAPAILAVSDYVRQPLLDLPLRTERIYNGVVLAQEKGRHSSFKKEFDIPDDAWVIGMIANFTENKRPNKFLEIASYVKKLRPQSRFVIVGHNTWNSRITVETLCQQAKEYGVEKELVLTGWRDDVEKILPTFDALVVPSLSESFPLVVLEAMASGVVVFANKTAGGPMEQIEDGRDGFLVNCDQPVESAEIIVRVLSNISLKNEISEHAYQRVQKEFDIATFIRNMDDFYNSLSGVQIREHVRV
ncbi:MAG: glycosyltransferase family 4 protein [Candidatus Omnitrophica bacterium]|nr:glycosyltransferase family 4 protein [Candidatus Omnitrophota bacterium]